MRRLASFSQDTKFGFIIFIF
jgi:cytochrome P450/NADPH-cytochrome P450 reductase